MTKKTTSKTVKKSTLAKGSKRGSTVHSADSGRMVGLSRIPTVQRREDAIQLLMRLAK